MGEPVSYLANSFHLYRHYSRDKKKWRMMSAGNKGVTFHRPETAPHNCDFKTEELQMKTSCSSKRDTLGDFWRSRRMRNKTMLLCLHEIKHGTLLREFSSKRKSPRWIGFSFCAKSLGELILSLQGDLLLQTKVRSNMCLTFILSKFPFSVICYIAASLLGRALLAHSIKIYGLPWQLKTLNAQSSSLLFQSINAHP